MLILSALTVITWNSVLYNTNLDKRNLPSGISSSHSSLPFHLLQYLNPSHVFLYSIKMSNISLGPRQLLQTILEHLIIYFIKIKIKTFFM